MTSPVSMPAGHAILASDLDAYENATAAWQTWAPTLTNLTLGNGAVIAKYRQVGKTVDYRFKFRLGSTSAVGTSPKFTAPVTPNADYAFDEDQMGNALLLDSGSAVYPAFVWWRSTVLEIATINAAGTYAFQTAITATVPFTWTTSDVLSASGTYEAA